MFMRAHEAVLNSISASCVGSFLTGLTVTPFDVITKQMQAQAARSGYELCSVSGRMYSFERLSSFSPKVGALVGRDGLQ
jgi:hypothetical protein